jgi:hypothetical protein
MFTNSTSVHLILKKGLGESIYFFGSGGAASVAASMLCAYDTGAEMGGFCVFSQRYKLLDIGHILRVYTKAQ